MSKRRSKVYYLVQWYYLIHHTIFSANKYGIEFQNINQTHELLVLESLFHSIYFAYRLRFVLWRNSQLRNRKGLPQCSTIAYTITILHKFSASIAKFCGNIYRWNNLRYKRREETGGEKSRTRERAREYTRPSL